MKKDLMFIRSMEPFLDQGIIIKLILYFESSKHHYTTLIAKFKNCITVQCYKFL